MVDDYYLNLIFRIFDTIINVLKSVQISLAGFTINLYQFSLGIIVFGVLMGLFINYTKAESASDVSSAYGKYKKNKERKK